MHITEAQFTKAMQEAVAERGEDYVYRVRVNGSCVYVDADGSPSCLIGLALSKINPSRLPDYHHPRNSIPALTLLDGIVPDAVAWAADDAQTIQDTGHTWAEALKAYNRRLASYRG